MIDASGCLIIEPFSGASTGWLYHDGFGWLENRNKIISVVVRNGVNVVLTPELHGASVNGMFHGCANLVKADLSGLNTSEVVDASYMFSDCLSLTDLNLSGWDTSKVTDMTGMFSGCASLKALDVAGLNTSKVTEMGDMFSGCESLESLNLKSFDVSGVMNMRNMFSDCSGLTVLNVSGWSTSKVTDMSEMFSGCSSLVDLSLSGWDTSSVENMSNMFYYCTSLESLDLKHFDVKSVKNMSNMFCGCSNLISLDLLGWITSNVTSMDGMFDGCSSLGDLNLSSFDTSRVASTQSMFSNCSNLISITLGAAFAIEGYGSNGRIVFPVPSGNGLTGRWLSSDDGIAYTADGIPSKIAATYTAQEDGSDSWNQSGTCIWRIGKEGDLVIKPLSGQRGELSDSFSWNNSSSLLKSVSFEGEVVAPSSLNGMFSDRTSLTAVDFTGFDTSNVTSMFCMFSGCSSLESLNLTGFDTSDVTDMSNMFQGCSSLETLDLSIFNTSKVTDMLCMFSGCSSLSSLNLSGWNTASAVNMSNMFGYCSSLESLDLPGWNTSSVANMSGIFQGCSSLESINLSDFDTSKVVDMSDMFRDCASVDTLDLSAFNTSKVTDMSYMFSGCSSLETLDLSGWTNPMVADMSWMFNRCSALTALDLSNFGTSRVTNMSGMFGSCSSLVSLNLKSFDTANVENMSYMFYCSTSIDKIPPSKLRAIDLSSFSTSRVKSMFYMFWGCSSLESLDVSGFDTSRVTDTGWMFGDCSSLKSIDLSSWNTSKVTSMSCMFLRCSSLESLDVSSFNTSKVTSMHGMFEGCSSLESLDLSSFDTLKVTDMASMLESCSGMRSVALGRNFAFIPPRFSYERVGLPTPLGDGFTGLWVSSADGKAYAPDSIPNNVAATYTAQVKGEAAKIAISKSMFTVDANAKTYTGFQVVPEVSSTTLQRGVDYTVSYGTNVNAGPGTVTITGAGSYTGTLSYSFTINKAAPSYVVPSGLSAVYGQTLGDVTLPTGFSWQDDASAKVGDVGRKTFLAVYIPVDTANYETVRNIEVGLDVAPAPLAEGDFSFDLSDAVYAGNPVTGRVSSAVLVEGKDYSVVYADNVNAGAASITVSGVGNYDSGSSITKHFIIEKVDPTYKAPSPISATEGQILGDLKLPDGFSWQDELSTSVGDAGEHIFKAKFTPRDTVNYNVVEDVPVTVVVTESSDGWNPCGDCVWKIDDQGCLVIKPANGVSGTLENYTTNVENYAGNLMPKTPWEDRSDDIVSARFEKGVTAGSDLGFIFWQLCKLESVDFSNLDMSNVRSMRDAFRCCESLKRIDGLGSKGGVALEDATEMFSLCRSLKAVDLNNIDLSGLDSAGWMFSNCSSLEELDLSGLGAKSSQYRYLSGMLYGCSSLERVDLSGLDTRGVRSMRDMFSGCTSLKYVRLGENFSFSGAGSERLCSLPTPERDGFEGKWRNAAGETFAPSEVPDGAGAYEAVFPEHPDGWTGCGTCMWSIDNDGKLTIKPIDGESGELAEWEMNNNRKAFTPWRDWAAEITSVTVEGKVVAPSHVWGMFEGCGNMASADLGGLDVSRATDMSFMFYGCKSLRSLDLSRFDTKNATDMGWMFSGCSALESLDVSGFDTSSVTEMGLMFDGCSSLQSLDVSGFDTTKAANVAGMFQRCPELRSLDVSGFDTSSVTDMDCMFSGCSKLEELDLSNFDTSSVTSMWAVFKECDSLRSLDLSSFETSNVKTMRWLFFDCNNLESVNVSSFDTSQVTDMVQMFIGCTSLQSLDLSSFDTSNVATMDWMFAVCPSLESVTLGKNFSFCGAGSERQCSLPEQNAGNWVDVATGKAYRADAIPNNVAATYRVQRSLLESDFTVDVSDAVYSGEPVTGRVSSDSLEEGVDYDVTYSGNVNAGEAAVSIAGKGLYTGSLSYAFRIIPAGITADMVSGISAQMEATGSQLRPEPAVAFNGKALAEGEDYTLSYGENVEPGEGSVTVSAIEGGNFTGSAIVYFDIEKKAEPVNPDPGTGGGGTDPAPIPDPGTGGGSGEGGGAPAPAPEPRQFAVTYHLDGGANAASNPATFAAGTAVALAAPTRDGYEFLGWYADAALTKRVTGIPADASGDVELWAKWALKAAPAPTFPDVDYSESSWYGKAVTYVAEKGLITGYTDGDKAGLFGVGDTLTRAQLATILWRNACPDEAASYNSASAKDVTGIAGSADGQYYTAAANWAVKNGVISGYVREDGTHDFAAGDDVSFEQLVTILARLCATDDELAAAGDDLSAFADGGGASGWSRAAFAWAAGKGLVRGYDTPSGKMLSPGEDVARERVAVVLMRAFEMGLLK